jgi:hypothetical protein
MRDASAQQRAAVPVDDDDGNRVAAHALASAENAKSASASQVSASQFSDRRPSTR